MPKYVPFDELRLVFRVPGDLDEAACDAIRRALESRQFRTSLRRTILRIVRQHPELGPVRFRVSG
jgi:hypothetical protein